MNVKNVKNDIIDIMMLIRSLEGYIDLHQTTIIDSFQDSENDDFYKFNSDFYKNKIFECHLKLDNILRKYDIFGLPDPVLDKLPRFKED